MRKRHIWPRIAAAAFSMTLAVGLLAGCGNSGGKGRLADNTDKVLFRYDGKDVTLKEAWIYAKMTAAQYEATYSSYFGADFWTMEMGTDKEGNPTTFEDYTKQQVITQIKRIIVLDNKAKELKCSLSDEEKKQCGEYAKAFSEDDSGKAILEECGAGKDDIQKIYEDNALASKVQEQMVKDTDTNVSDDEARKTKIYRIVFETTATDENGQTKDMTEKEAKAVRKEANAAYKKIQAGTSIEEVAKEKKYTNTAETFAAGESEEGEDFEKLLAGMKDGDMVDGVQKCENGYVIARLDAYTDKDATASNKESIIAERQQETFSKTYDEWTKDLEKDWDYQEAVDQDLWAQVVLHSEESTSTENTEETTAADTAGESGTEAPAEGTAAAK